MIIIKPKPLLLECEVGFEPTNTGFADLPLKPLRHSHVSELREVESNHRLQAYEACQLPLLHPTCNGRGGRTRTYEVVRREIYSLLRLPLRDTPLCFWQEQKASNPRLSVLETDVLPAELYSRF